MKTSASRSSSQTPVVRPRRREPRDPQGVTLESLCPSRTKTSPPPQHQPSLRGGGESSGGKMEDGQLGMEASVGPSPSTSSCVMDLPGIKKVLLQPAVFPAHNKGVRQGGKGRGHAHHPRRGGKGIASPAGVLGDQGGLGIEVFRWQGHERVAFLIFPNRLSLRKSLTRLSVFLEDLRESGKVVGADFQPGKYAAAAYTGHNFRPSDLKRFLEVRNARDGVPIRAVHALTANLAGSGAFRLSARACRDHALRDGREGVSGLRRGR